MSDHHVDRRPGPGVAEHRRGVGFAVFLQFLGSRQMQIITDLVLIDLDDPVQAAGNRLDAIKPPAGLDLAEDFIVGDHQRHPGVPRAAAAADPDVAAFFRRLHVCPLRRNADPGKQVDGHHAAQSPRAFETVGRMVGAGGHDARKFIGVETD
jgi:hypothetical protein